MSLKGQIQYIPKVDKTLTVDGACADAKVTGEEFKKVNQRFENLPKADKTFTQEGQYADAKETGIELGKKAPKGYGLGEHAKALANVDLNNVTEAGFYCYDASAGVSNIPVAMPSILSVHPFYSSDYVEQEVILLDGKGTTIKRVRHAGTWFPWEYENPPMALMEEYRTTERWIGKPVYTKVVSYSSPTDIGNAEGTYGFAIEFSTPNFKDLIRFGGTVEMVNGNVFPSVNTDEGFLGLNYMNSGGIALAIKKKVIPANTIIYIQVWYTKHGD